MKLAITVLLLFPLASFAEDDLGALGAPPNPKVDVRWNRFYDTKELGEILDRLGAAFPGLTKLHTIGTSVGGRSIRGIEITSHSKGDPARKAGFYIDGNIHGNEVQGAEAALYTAWYLLENYGRVAKVTELVDERVFYIFPTINPDGRDAFLLSPNTAHSLRGGLKPWDNDGDGRSDEDGFDDLDGDGNIVQMRRRNPHGRWKAHAQEPRLLVPCEPDEEGEFERLDEEGLDNDGDGQVNEDGPGGYDPNRNWPTDWQPPYVQHGAHDFPLSLPEDRAVARFWMARPNLAGAQSYHNAGGMILRSPGQQGGHVPERDAALYDVIGRKGEQMLPGYKYMIIWKDLYTVWGGEVDWFYFGRGVVTFTNELWTEANLFRTASAGLFADTKEDRAKFNKLLLMKDAFVEWKAFKHPTYGDIEIGGFKKNFGRTPPSFLLEEECHRNMAFTLYHADQMPRLSLDAPAVRALGDGLYAVRVSARNARMIPSRTAIDVASRISKPDELTIAGDGVTALSAGIVKDKDFNRVEPVAGKPSRIRVDSVPGMGETTVEWVVKGSGVFRVTLDSVKGGRVEVAAEIPK
ncbi:MAG: peptidase m14 carboxypeptidase [Planctomycetota bacterium]|nr:MAG: peptidase m14 carboxypeptidase [Planctomycetota bacterium]